MPFKITMHSSAGAKTSEYSNPQEALIAAHGGIRASMHVTVVDLERGIEITVPQLEELARTWGP